MLTRATHYGHGRAVGSVPEDRAIWGAATTNPAKHPVELQHMSIMYAGSVTVPLIVGSALKLDTPAGATFSVVNPMILIASQYGMQAVYGAMLASGVVGLLIAKLITGRRPTDADLARGLATDGLSGSCS